MLLTHLPLAPSYDLLSSFNKGSMPSVILTARHVFLFPGSQKLSPHQKACDSHDPKMTFLKTDWKSFETLLGWPPRRDTTPSVGQYGLTMNQLQWEENVA
jgi:hypothetical protein